MYAMHYAITLPADYDMRVIRERIASKGPLLDTFPGLGLKAYLIRERGVRGSPINQYAPFYLWASTRGMGRFLWEGGGFGAIVASFGRPPVRHWTGVTVLAGPQPLAKARMATIREDIIAADVDPTLAVGASRDALLEKAAHPGLCLSALAVDPQSWKLVRFALWAEEPPAEAGTRYDVAYLSTPEVGAMLGG